MEAQALLRELGRRLRAARAEAGLSLSELARTAGVSRRYVTEAEAGRANLSVAKLAALAEALGTTPAHLLEPAPHQDERIALVGLRGAGKSTLGRRLALALEAPFIELDRRIEELAGMPLAEVFDLHGTDGFHHLEGEALESVLREGGRLVLATGGSIVRSTRNYDRLLTTCRTVWLSATPREHFQRVLDQGDRRPMRDRPRAREELAALLEERRPQYERCELCLSTSGRSVEDVLAELLRSLGQPVRDGSVPLG